MQGEQRGDERAAPERGGHLVEDEEKQKGVGDVKEEAGEMMPSGIEAEELLGR